MKWPSWGGSGFSFWPLLDPWSPRPQQIIISGWNSSLLQVHLFVCNEDEDIKLAFDVGATGVMSDYPSLLTSYFSRNRRDWPQTRAPATERPLTRETGTRPRGWSFLQLWADQPRKRRCNKATPNLLTELSVTVLFHLLRETFSFLHEPDGAMETRSKGGGVKPLDKPLNLYLDKVIKINKWHPFSSLLLKVNKKCSATLWSRLYVDLMGNY